MGKSVKQYFAAVPARAIGDARLSALHYKALGAIALHDRMAAVRKKGQGCWASRKTLAEEIGCNYTNLSTAMTQLATWGYIYSRPHPLSKKQSILHVVYDDRDAAFVGAKPRRMVCPTGKQSDAEGAGHSLPTGEQPRRMVCPEFGKSVQDQSFAGDNVYSVKRIINSAEAGKGNSAETASPDGDDLLRTNSDTSQLTGESARRLREIEALVKEVCVLPLTSPQFDALLKAQHECWDIEDQHEGETLGYWAQRLGEEINTYVDDRS